MDNQKIQTFIFIHDQDILLDFFKVEKFNNLGEVTYIFLGEKDTSKISGLTNVIISRDLPINIEEYPKLTSFTGWYSIWKNKLYDSDYINLFEYDINIVDNFNEIIKNTISDDIDVIGYIPLNVHHYNFIKHKPWCIDLLNSINRIYKTNVDLFVDFLPVDKVCSVTSNHTFSVDSFESYMKWIEPMIDDIKNSKLSGHQVERSISLFYLTNNKKYEILGDVLKHFQFDSHKTQDINENKMFMFYNQLLN